MAPSLGVMDVFTNHPPVPFVEGSLSKDPVGMAKTIQNEPRSPVSCSSSLHICSLSKKGRVVSMTYSWVMPSLSVCDPTKLQVSVIITLQSACGRTYHCRRGCSGMPVSEP